MTLTCMPHLYTYIYVHYRIFFKVLSSQSFFKGKGCGSQNPIWRTKRHIIRTFLPSQQGLSKRQSPLEHF